MLPMKRKNNNELLEAPSEISTPVPTTLAEPSKSKTTESKKRKTGFCKPGSKNSLGFSLLMMEWVCTFNLQIFNL